MANAYAQNVIDDRQRADANYYSNALRGGQPPVQSAHAGTAEWRGGSRSEGRANSLQILSQLQSDEVQLEQAAAAPTAPSSPKVVRNTALGRAARVAHRSRRRRSCSSASTAGFASRAIWRTCTACRCLGSCRRARRSDGHRIPGASRERAASERSRDLRPPSRAHSILQRRPRSSDRGDRLGRARRR